MNTKDYVIIETIITIIIIKLIITIIKKTSPKKNQKRGGGAPVQERVAFILDFCVRLLVVEAAPREARRRVAYGQRRLEPICTDRWI